MRPLPFGRSLVAGVRRAPRRGAAVGGSTPSARRPRVLGRPLGRRVGPVGPADEADRRPRLHPQRPVRPVLPRRPGRLLRATRASTVTFQNEIDANLVPKVGQGQVDIGISDGTSVIPAVSQGIPIKYVATIYGQFPSIVFGKESSGIASAADLKGKKIGIPGTLRLVLDHAPGPARLGRADAERRR